MNWRSAMKTPIGEDYTVADARAARFLWPAGWVSLLGIASAAAIVGDAGRAWLTGLIVLSGGSFPTQLVLLKLHRVRLAVTLYALTFLTVAGVGLWFTGGTSGPFAGTMLFPLIGVAVAGSPRALKICVIVGSVIILASIPATREMDGFPVPVSALLALLIFATAGLLLAFGLGWYRDEVKRGEEQREELLKQMWHEEILQATSALMLRRQKLDDVFEEVSELIVNGLSAQALLLRLPRVSDDVLVFGPLATKIDPAAADVLAAMEQPPSDHGRAQAGNGPVNELAFAQRGFNQAASVVIRGAGGAGHSHGLLVVLFEAPNLVTPNTRGLLSGVGRLLGLAIDRAQAEQQQQGLATQLRHSQKLEALGRLSAGVAHDFNNLMTIVMTGASLAVDAVDDEETREDLTDILQAAESASTLTRQLLAFGRQQASAAQLVSINERLSDVGRMLHRLLGDDVQLQMNLGTELKGVLIDPVLLEQAIVNLAVNARDAMPAGGRFTLTTRRQAVDDDLAALLQLAPGEHVLIEAADSGDGMPPDVVERIFEPFFTTKARGGGTGLGLATTHGIIRQFGGAIRVKSAPGEGSRFSILLPIAREDVTATTALRLLSSPSDEATPGRVVLVDDDVLLRAVIARALRRRGYDVHEAKDADAALDALDGGQYDALITDVKMPGVSGIELARRARERYPALPILFISGEEQVETDAGQIFLSKPFTPEVLDAALRELATAA